MPVGCAATDEVVEVPTQPPPVSAEKELSATMTIALQNCVAAEASQLSRHAYEISFEIDATSAGVVRGVEMKRRGLENAGIETCMLQVLESLYVRQYLPQEELFQSSPQSNLQSSKALLGTTAVLPQLIRLAPIVLTVPGCITVVVGVVIVVAVAAVAVGSMSAECAEEWDKAFKECRRQADSNDPDYGVTGGYIDMKACARSLVRVGCGGNRVDDGGQGARPGRRT